MANTELHDLVDSLGAVYWQDPQVPEGYALSGAVVTTVTNLIDGVSITKAGDEDIGITQMCTQDVFLYNVAAAAGNAYIRRTSYGTVVTCLQTDFTLFFVTDDPISGTVHLLVGYGTAAVNPSFCRASITKDVGPDRITFAVSKRKPSGGSTVTNQVTNISLTHHVFELLCTNTTWEMLVDGVSLGSGTWSNSGTAWNALANFQSGAFGHTATPDGTLQHRQGQMALFPSILSADDRALVRNAMTLAMCSGHPTGDNPIWAGTDF